MIVPTSPEEIEFASSLEIEARLYENVNYFLEISSQPLREVYSNFVRNNQTLSSLKAMNLMLVAFTMPYVLLLIANRPYCDTVYENFNWILYVLFVVLIHFSNWRTYFHQKTVVAAHRGSLPEAERKSIIRYQMKIFMLFHCIECYRLISKVITGKCNTVSNWAENWNCNQLAEAHAIPSEPAIVIAMMPLMYLTMMRGAHFTFAMILWVMTVMTLVFSSIYAGAINSMLFLMFYTVSSIVVLVTTRRLSFFLFFTHHKLQETLQERERAADEARLVGIRKTIGSVAYEQKMALGILQSVLELMKNTIQETIAKKQHDTLTIPDADEFIYAMSEGVTNMRNTNSFMLMTINRCIDYTKASKGVKLVPKYETIDLMETLSMPLNCMKDIQQRVSILLEPVARDICSHVITDKQWLQENVLCLLSNAVKHSIGGEVVVRVARETIQAMPYSGEIPEVPSGSYFSDGLDESTLPQLSNSVVPMLSLVALRGDSSTKLRPRTRSPRRFSMSTEYLRVQIIDSGAGMSRETMSKLFSTFQLAETLTSGTGLGLFSLAKRVEALDGRCGVEHRTDGKEGTTFFFLIPYRPDEDASSSALQDRDTLIRARKESLAQELQVSPRQSLSARESLPSHRELDILIVDDSPAIVKMTAMMLLRHKHNVAAAMNGAEAVKQVAERLESAGRGFDVILMDLMMPVMDGLEATKRIRHIEVSQLNPLLFSRGSARVPQAGEEGYERVPVLAESSVQHIIIGVSAHTDVNEAHEAYKLGMDALLPKPFSLETFYRVYDFILSKRGEQKELRYFH